MARSALRGSPQVGQGKPASAAAIGRRWSQAPRLSWGAVAAAARYALYRDDDWALPKQRLDQLERGQS